MSCRGPRPAKKKRYTNSLGEEEESAQICPCDRTVESRTRVVGECKIHKEERDVLEMRKINECDTKFGTLDIVARKRSMS